MVLRKDISATITVGSIYASCPSTTSVQPYTPVSQTLFAMSDVHFFPLWLTLAPCASASCAPFGCTHAGYSSVDGSCTSSSPPLSPPSPPSGSEASPTTRHACAYSSGE